MNQPLMTLDYYLIARAEKLAGEHVHSVANLLTAYQLGWELNTLKSVSLAREAERKLRSIVLEAEYSLAKLAG